MATDTLRHIDNLRSLVQALREAGNDEAAEVVEEAADEIDRLVEQVDDLESEVSGLKDDLADARDDLANAAVQENSSQRLQSLEAALDGLEEAARLTRRALDPAEPVPTVRAY